MTQSYEDGSSLSTNALDAHFFSGVGACGLWPGNPPTPATGSGVRSRVKKRGGDAIREARRRVLGEVGWEADVVVGSPGSPPGGVQSAAARTLPGALRGAGRARARQAPDPAKLIEVEGQEFFSGSAAVAAGHLVSMESWTLNASDERYSDRLVFCDFKVLFALESWPNFWVS